MSKDARGVFVVHGRNDTMRKSMFDFLRSIDLHPLEWTSALALTGSASPYIGEVLAAAFDHAQAVVVLLTPDEVTYLWHDYGLGADDPETKPAGQARPNVLFEAGMAMGRDDRRTVLVEIGELRPFSDVAGRHVIRLNNTVAKRQELAERLRIAGCAVDLRGTDWHAAGDFTPPAPPGDGRPLGRRVPSSTQARPALDFDLKLVRQGGNKLDKLQVINRGTEAAYDVNLTFPDGCALRPFEGLPIAKIPGGGKSVTLMIQNMTRYLGGGPHLEAFDVVVRGRTADGQQVEQEVFIDVNG